MIKERAGVGGTLCGHLAVKLIFHEENLKVNKFVWK
jgi:hypothetical protein